MMMFETMNGSKFEVDGHKIRMIHESARPDAKEWRPLKAHSPVIKGRPVLLLWGLGPEENGKDIRVDLSMTDVVTKVEGEPDVEEMLWNHTTSQAN